MFTEWRFTNGSMEKGINQNGPTIEIGDKELVIEKHTHTERTDNNEKIKIVALFVNRISLFLRLVSQSFAICVDSICVLLATIYYTLSITVYFCTSIYFLILINIPRTKKSNRRSSELRSFRFREERQNRSNVLSYPLTGFPSSP